MKKLFAILAVSVLLLAGCSTNKSNGTTPSDGPDLAIPTGEGQAVVPEEGDIIIEIG